MESENSFTTILDTISILKGQLILFQEKMKSLEKMVKMQDKLSKKCDKKNKIKKGGSLKKSGFAKPSDVSIELCAFMNKEEGTKIARTDVTKALIGYIEENKLKNVTNGQIINPDEKLKILLGVDDNEQITYFTLQKYMNKHFIKNTETLSK